MSKTILYIAKSLDGFIAGPDGDLAWLDSVAPPESGGDYGYSELLQRIGSIVMGRKTYEKVISFGVDWPYPGIRVYVPTGREDLSIQSPDTYPVREDLKEFITGLKKKEEKDIWLAGGGQLITSFLHAGLLDRMIITVIPKVIGDGIPLFAPHPPPGEWQLVSAEAFDTGLVNLTYDKKQT